MSKVTNLFKGILLHYLFLEQNIKRVLTYFEFYSDNNFENILEFMKFFFELELNIIKKFKNYI